MTSLLDCTRSVKPRVARGLVRRAGRVELVLRTGARLVLVRVSKRQALEALKRATGMVEVALPFDDNTLILGE